MRQTANLPAALLPLLLMLAAPAALAQDVPFAEGDPNFLFIGNSYTGQNGLPAVFKSIVQDGIPEWKDTVDTNSVNPGGRTLASHYMSMLEGSDNSGLALQRYLMDDPVPAWKWMILQDQSQVPGFHPWDTYDSMYGRSKEAAVAFNELVKDVGGHTMFFMTWGRRDGDGRNREYYPNFLDMNQKLEDGYKKYQEATAEQGQEAYLAPVGLVFEQIYNDDIANGIDPTLREDPDGRTSLFRTLYNRDGSHPSTNGTYVAALTMYSAMTGKNPLDINYWPNQVKDEGVARRLQSAVSRTILRTFDSGEIDYPWETAFPATASPPTTPPPATSAPATQAPATQAPVTSAPVTSAPITQPPTTSAPGNQTKGSITVEFIYDEYPEEVSWTFVQEGAAQPMFLQTWDNDVEPNSTQIKTFDNLEVGATYIFRAIDSEGDGICSGNGCGSLGITNDVLGSRLYATRRGFRGYIEMYWEILPNGETSRKHISSQYRPGTWDELETMIAPSTQGWPGAFPTQPKNSLMINIKVDKMPEDLSWTLYRQDGNTREWNVVNQWNGTNVEDGALESIEFASLYQGWYRLLVQDAGVNGVCCEYGNGFVSVTGPIESANGTMGLVWGNNGQFLDEEEIFFRFRAWNGFVSHIRWAEN